MANVLDDLEYRGLIKDFSNKEELRKMLETKQTIYCGFDPSAPSMHVGNFVMISILMRLQKAGHRILALVGGGTGMIGDPSGKSKERNLQSEEVLAKNTQCLKDQLSRYLDFSDPSKGMLIDNKDWLGSMTIIELLRDYGKYFNIAYLLSKEIISSRLEAGLSFTEFTYNILQAVDFKHLYETYDCHIQIGGSDQWGNLTSGLELIRKSVENATAEVMTAHLITRSDGKKFGKSEKGALFLDKNMTSPYQIYQYFINTTDEDAIKYLKVFTFLTKDEIEDITREHVANLGMRIAQKKLAYEVVKTIHDEKTANEVLDMTNALFSGDVKSLSKNQLEDVLGDLTVELDANKILEDVLIDTKIAPSKREARTLITGNAISVNGDKVTDASYTFDKEKSLYGEYYVIRKGKKQYCLVKIK